MKKKRKFFLSFIHVAVLPHVESGKKGWLQEYLEHSIMFSLREIVC